MMEGAVPIPILLLKSRSYWETFQLGNQRKDACATDSLPLGFVILLHQNQIHELESIRRSHSFE